MYFFPRLIVLFIGIQILTAQLFAQKSNQHVQNWNTKQPSRFIENKGQVVDQKGNLRNDVKYIYSAPGFKAIFKANSFSFEVFTFERKLKQENTSAATGKAVDENSLPDKFKQPDDVTIHTRRIDIELLGANKHSQIIVGGKSCDYNNYYLAHTPEKGVQKVYSFTKLSYKNVWPNVDLVFYTEKEGVLKYDIIVHPGANMAMIKFNYKGAENIDLEEGKLNIQTSVGDLNESIPLSYLKETKESISVKYTKSGSTISFVSEYDKSKTLIIDPSIEWATYYGSDESEIDLRLSVISNGNFYISGTTASTNSIATTGAFQTSISRLFDIFISRFDSSGKRVWGTYYGGTESDYNFFNVTDKSGNIYIGGQTGSTAGIATTGAHQTLKSDSTDIFLVKFNSSGSRLWGTYFGSKGNDLIYSGCIDLADNIYLVGETTSRSSFATSGSHQTTYGGGYRDAFIAKFTSSGKRNWCTYYGGGDWDCALSITSDKNENIYLTGFTLSKSGISTINSFQPKHYSGSDAFLVKFDKNARRIWGTYHGRNQGERFITITYDNDRNLYLGGLSGSDSMATAGAFKTYLSYSSNSDYDAIIVKYDTSGNRIWLTYFGGESKDYATDIKSSTNGFIYVYGSTFSKSGISSSGAWQENYSDSGDCFILKIDSSGKKRVWSTYFGDKKYEVSSDIKLINDSTFYIAGNTSSDNNIATIGAHQSTYGGGWRYSQDGFIAKFNDNTLINIGALSVDSLGTSYCSNLLKRVVYVRVKNFSNIAIDSVEIGWSLNGSKIKDTLYLKQIKAGDTSSLISLDSISFITGKNILKIWTNSPNGIKDGTSSNDTIIKIIDFNSVPKVDFSYNDGCEPLSVGFVNNSIIDSGYKILSYYWDFGNDSTSNLANPKSVLAKPGIYKVKLVATSDKGCKDSITKNITVFPKPISEFTYENKCLDSAINFTNKSTIDTPYSIISSLWRFGDGDSSTKTNPAHIYKIAGTYSVELKSISNTGCTSIYTQKVIVYPKPVAKFYSNNTCQQDSVYFADSSKIDSGNIVSYLWNFGDGAYSTVQNPRHKYTSSGKYNVELFVTSQFDCTDSFIKTVEVYATPKALFTKKNVCLNEIVAFNNSSTIDSGNIMNYFWQFGDGDTATQKHPVHTYKAAGKYNVALTVISNFGCKDSILDSVIVYPLPKANFGTNNICQPEEAYFFNSSTSATAWLWNFGDSVSSTIQNPSHKYLSAGKYIVTLKVKNMLGCEDSITKEIEVYEIPQANFSVNSICVTDSLKLADSSKNITSRLWQFGDGFTSSLQNPIHKYPKGGNYIIWLYVTNNNGCKDSISHIINVDSTCVWPGDANADKIVDNKDILAIGVAYSDTGTNRPDTSTVWKANTVKDWANSFSSGANYKHADSNGDGIVSNMDTLAITRNYTKTHAKKENINSKKNNDPILKIKIQNDSLKAGDTLVAYIMLGENALPTKNAYGIAFSLSYDESSFSTPLVDFTGSWLGAGGISYSNATNGLDLAITRIDQKNVTGAGKIATIRLILKKDVRVEKDEFSFGIIDNILISGDEQQIPVNVENDSVQVYKVPNSIYTDEIQQPTINVYPNPFSGKTIIEYELLQPGKVGITLCDISGRSQLIMPSTKQLAGKHQFVLDAEEFKIASGIHLIKLEVNGVPTNKRIVKVD